MIQTKNIDTLKKKEKSISIGTQIHGRLHQLMTSIRKNSL